MFDPKGNTKQIYRKEPILPPTAFMVSRIPWHLVVWEGWCVFLPTNIGEECAIIFNNLNLDQSHLLNISKQGTHVCIHLEYQCHGRSWVSHLVRSFARSPESVWFASLAWQQEESPWFREEPSSVQIWFITVIALWILTCFGFQAPNKQLMAYGVKYGQAPKN